MTYDPQLWDGLPSRTNRYDNVYAGTRKNRTASCPSVSTPGPSAARAGINVAHRSKTKSPNHPNIRTLEMRKGWKECRYLNGRTYFYHEQLGIMIETDIRPEYAMDQIARCCRALVILRDHVLPEAAAFDVFLDRSRKGTCRYYLVDHMDKTICLLRQRTTSEFGISEWSGTWYLQVLPVEEYWKHMEYQSMEEKYFVCARARLQDILANVLPGLDSQEYLSHTAYVTTDATTSEGSTSPFAPEECEAYLLTLDKYAASGSVYSKWLIGEPPRK
ncbi:WW domain protein [Ceratobasidium sp. AG-Ba]|nr:WW domain protein [Ceratobasidium sp. AG-Ba]